jgi:hypothetical protein
MSSQGSRAWKIFHYCIIPIIAVKSILLSDVFKKNFSQSLQSVSSKTTYEYDKRFQSGHVKDRIGQLRLIAGRCHENTTVEP